jgi:hypothetical protein
VCVVVVVVGNDCFGQSHIILTALGVGFVVLDRSGFGCVYVAHSNKCHVHIPKRSGVFQMEGSLVSPKKKKRARCHFKNKNDDGTYLRMSGNNIATESRKQTALKEQATAVKRD